MTTNLFQDTITWYTGGTYFDLFRHMMSRNVLKSNFATDGAPYTVCIIHGCCRFISVLLNSLLAFPMRLTKH